MVNNIDDAAFVLSACDPGEYYAQRNAQLSQ